MAYRSLRDFIAALEAEGELVRVKAPVSTHLEMTEICTRLLADGGPAVLFENPVDAEGQLAAMPCLEPAMPQTSPRASQRPLIIAPSLLAVSSATKV